MAEGSATRSPRPVRGDALAHRLHQLWPPRSVRRKRVRRKERASCGAPYLALAMASAIALAAVPPVRAQAVADPGRSPDAAFVAKASDATAVDAELATLAVTRARTAQVKAFAKQVLDTHAALARELAAMGPRSPAAAPPTSGAGCGEGRCASARRDEGRCGAAVAATGRFDAAFVAAMVASREAAVALFEAESRDGRDAEVKEWAARQLPALREQLERSAPCGHARARRPVRQPREDQDHEEAHSRRV